MTMDIEERIAALENRVDQLEAEWAEVRRIALDAAKGFGELPEIMRQFQAGLDQLPTAEKVEELTGRIEAVAKAQALGGPFFGAKQ